MNGSVDMAGSGASTAASGSSVGSGRAHFRSQTGCCICGTKSSSSRFTASQRFAEHFGTCFGPGAVNRSGDLCNACVLCVKRWLQRGKQANLFVQVLDSKKGPGPKHMKEITKRARRREARQAAAAAASNPKAHPKTSSTSSTNHNHDSALATHPKFATSITRSSGSTNSGTCGLHVNGNLANAANRSTLNCSKHATSGSLHPAQFSWTHHSSAIGTRSHGLLASTPNVLESDCRYHVRSSIGPGSVLCKSNGRPGSLASLEHRPRFSELDDSKGATRTRAAAARQQEAFNARAAAAAAASRTNNMRSSTPSQACLMHNSLSPTTPSETSEYGSLGFSSRGSSVSSSSRCCGWASNGDSNRVDCALGSCLSCMGRNPVPCQNQTDLEKSDLSEFHCQCNTHNNSSSSALDDCAHVCCCCCCACACSCSCSGLNSAPCCGSEFRHPANPTLGHALHHGPTSLVVDPDVQSNSSQLSPASSLTTGSNASSTVPATRRYNRRVVLPPIKMTPNPELDSLLRDIMERNSQAINYDSREMHMAVQRCLRLRSRTIQAASASGSASGRASSISSADGSIDAVMSTNSQLGSAKASSNGPVDSIDTGLGRSNSSLIGSDDCPPCKRRCCSAHSCPNQIDSSFGSQNKTNKPCCHHHHHHHHHHHCHAHHQHPPPSQQQQQQQRQRQSQQTEPDSLTRVHSLSHHQLRHSRLSFHPYSTPNPRKS